MTIDWNKHGPALYEAVVSGGGALLRIAVIRVQRAMNAEARREFFAARFGAGWAVCRPTADNKKKYSRCISYREYVQAEEDYLNGA